MSDIQDEAYSEAMDGIKRLKQRLDQMSQKETYKEWKRNQAEIERLKGQIDVRDSVISKLSGTVAEWRPLIARAADALAPYEWRFPDGNAIRQLIAELRRATE